MTSMDTAFKRFLRKYGQAVQVCRGEERVECHAFLQPVLERRENWRQTVPTPLGVMPQDRWIYLGDPEISLEEAEDGYVAWRGRRFEIMSAQPIYVGSELSHWWGVLRSAEASGAGS